MTSDLASSRQAAPIFFNRREHPITKSPARGGAFRNSLVLTSATRIRTVVADVAIHRSRLSVRLLAVIRTAEMAAGAGIFHLPLGAFDSLLYVTFAHVCPPAFGVGDLGLTAAPPIGSEKTTPLSLRHPKDGLTRAAPLTIWERSFPN